MKALRPPLLFPYLISAFADEVESLHGCRHRLIFGREIPDGLQCSAIVDPRGQLSKTPCLLSKIVRALHHKTPTTHAWILFPLSVSMNGAESFWLRTHHGRNEITEGKHIVGTALRKPADLRVDAGKSARKCEISGTFGLLDVKVSYIQGVVMPDSWDAAKYRKRAKKWRTEAETLPPGKERDACVVLAEGYATLAALIEEMNNGCIDGTGGN
jgi:hypothetical protein